MNGCEENEKENERERREEEEVITKKYVERVGERCNGTNAVLID